MFEIAPVILLIGGLFLLALAVYLFCSTILGAGSDQAALALAEEKEESKKAPLIQFSKPLVQRLTLKYSSFVKSENYKQKVKQKILYAGLAKEINTNEFIGLQILWGIFFPILAMILNFGLQMGYPFFVFIGISGFGIYFPHFYLNSLISQRSKSIERDLPFFIDLLALSTEAGLDFITAIQKITEKADKNSILAEEFHIVLKEITLGSSRKEALANLSERLRSSEIQSFVTMLKDADETGASIAETLKAKSEQIRYQRFNKAEEEGAKASQKILIPMMIFIIPAVMITVFAPIALQFYYGN